MARILLINIYYSPDSFGGATVVCEETARCLRDLGWEVLVFTANKFCLPYEKYRYCIDDGINVVSVGLPEVQSYDESYCNEYFSRAVVEELNLFKPDIAHVHCVQGIGASVIKLLKDSDTPVVLTIHDCWWFCERQFMINSNEKFCDNQGNPGQCLHCVVSFGKSETRRKYLLKTAATADRILYPSVYFKSLYESWGFPDNKAFVNRDGVTLPSKDFKRRSGSRLTFGYIGGPGPIKGGDLIQQAFQNIDDSSYELIVVDAAKKVDQSWTDLEAWKIPGKITVHPPYTQSEMYDFYSKIDVLLFPSKWKESFGLAVREALCRDIWVISTDQGGVIEDSRDGVNATTIPMRDNHLALKDAILDALSNKDKLKKHINRHKDEIRDYEQQTQELVGHFADLLKSP